MLNIASNLPNSSKLYTLDLDYHSFEELEQSSIDKALSQKHLEYLKILAFHNTPYERRIIQLFGDSNSYDFTQFNNSVDMVYIDGGHDKKTATSDSKNAFKMLSKNHLSCIAWHDFNNPNHPDVTDVIAYFSKIYYIFHIEGTMVCIYLNDPSQFIFKELV